MLCVGDARVAGVPQRWWAVALPDGTLLEGSRGVELSAERAHVRGVLDLQLEEPAGVEVVSPHGRSYIWTRKHAPVHVRGRVSAAGQAFGLDGDDGFVDESAGYHARRTAWRWSAGVGRNGRRPSRGVEPRGRRSRCARASSERTVLGRRRAARGAAPGVRRRPQLGRRPALPRVVGPRVAHEPAGDAEQLPAAFRRVQRRAAVRFAASRRATGSWRSMMCAGEGVPCVARRAAGRGTRAGCGARSGPCASPSPRRVTC